MILLTARNLSRQFDREPVFRDVEFEIRPGEKVGLVGPNGTGKSTLLKILADRDDADTGDIERHPSIDVELLEQEPVYGPERTLWEEAQAGLDHLYQLQRESADLAERMAAAANEADSERLHRRYDEIQHELQRLDAYHVDHRVEEVLSGLGFKEQDFHRPLVQFSGGQQSRAALARLLLRAPDLMLLDEPTNHLDIQATEWLEQHLSRSAQSMILVSHDRYFLDRVTNRTFELFGARLTDYTGNFSAYWKQRAERAKVAERTFEKQQEFIARTEDFIRRNKYGQKHAQAADREKKLARVEVVDRIQDVSGPAFDFGQASRTGDWVVDAVDVAKGYAHPLFTEFTLRIERGERVGILGPNGSGKTTLLRTLLGELKPDVGAVRFGTGVKIGYFDQQLACVDPNLDAVEAIRPADNPEITPGVLRKLLARFGIKGDLAFQQVGSLSGGEKSKVALAGIAAQNVNVLVLDEPTNHLDLWARAALEDSLKEFEGTILFVSHDRYFLDRVAQRVIVLDPPGWKTYEGNYSDFVQFLRNRDAEIATNSTTARPAATKKAEPDAPPSESKAKRKRRFKYRKVEDLEVEIHEMEELIRQLEADLVDPQIQRDGERIKDTLKRYEEAKAALPTLYEHWEEAVELN